MAQVRTYVHTMRVAPSPNLNVDKAVKERLKMHREEGMSEVNARETEPLLRRALERQAKGYEASGVTSLFFSDRVSSVRTFAPNLSDDTVAPLYESVGQGVTVEESAGSGIRIKPGEVLSLFDHVADRVVLGMVDPATYAAPGTRTGASAQTLRIQRSQPGRSPQEAVITYEGGRLSAAKAYILYPRKFLTASYRLAYKNGKLAEIAVQRYHADGTLIRTESFVPANQETTAPTTPFAAIKVGADVFDFRLGGDQAVSYKWSGSLPSLDELRRMETARTDDEPREVNGWIYIAAGAVLVFGAFLSLRRRR